MTSNKSHWQRGKIVVPTRTIYSKCCFTYFETSFSYSNSPFTDMQDNFAPFLGVHIKLIKGPRVHVKKGHSVITQVRTITDLYFNICYATSCFLKGYWNKLCTKNIFPSPARDDGGQTVGLKPVQAVWWQLLTWYFLTLAASERAHVCNEVVQK